MIPLFRVVGMLGLTALCACSEERHPLDRHLADLRPVKVVKLPDMGWPPGTILCTMAIYQNELIDSAPLADRVNEFLKKKQFRGTEDYWSLIVVKPMPEGDAGIEQLLIKSGDYDVINDLDRIMRDAETLPPGFTPQACVPLEKARVLVTRTQRNYRKLIIFGTE
ncbi:hypothetical protein [Janthinobacterium sp. MDT1-19]|uniref:hypothetical protein n=1 Tax=Janthinobacterium sp. MDT1-19 TaxID=1259339 RepID=UPI003F249BC2